MAKQTQLTAPPSHQRRRPKVKRKVARIPTDELDQLPIASLNSVRHNPIGAQAVPLSNSHLGIAHYNKGGEKRTYAAGKATYEQRVAEIKKRAEAETWPECDDPAGIV